MRYSEELHPYKYAGYPMLIKTIQMETNDEKLFHKSAPLLAAASECAYFTVKCSALNAEELRRYSIWTFCNNFATCAKGSRGHHVLCPFNPTIRSFFW